MNQSQEKYFEKESVNASGNPGDDAPKQAGLPKADPFDAAMRAAVQPKRTYAQEVPPARTSRYAPVGAFEFFVIFLLLLIPVVNLVLLAIWSLGGCKKVNKRNFARAYLVMLALFIGLGFWGFTVLKGLYRDIFVMGSLPADSPAAGVIEFFGEKATGALLNQAARRAAEQPGESLNPAEQPADLSVIAALALAQDREGLRNMGFSEDAIEGLLAAAKDPTLLARYLSQATKP